MWQINKDNAKCDLLDKLYELERKLVEAELNRDVPEWMAWKGLLNEYKVDRVLIPKQIERIKKMLSE